MSLPGMAFRTQYAVMAGHMSPNGNSSNLLKAMGSAISLCSELWLQQYHFAQGNTLFSNISSAPRFPQSNGAAESAVVIAKKILTKLRQNRRDIVKVPEKEDGTAGQASSTTEDNSSATARPKEARGTTEQTFGHDTTVNDSLEKSHF
ncbi:hypothetical protein PR048_010521 [Dryococelus australis]|uniref:Uncharacterized protein n=1 Tax=Dryococelus australis TaxID=614101 RepID=A0ABQ9I310_9NEOP|nr:hypothetical protein PR048_010521 [Dryococelus australis]